MWYLHRGLLTSLYAAIILLYVVLNTVAPISKGTGVFFNPHLGGLFQFFFLKFWLNNDLVWCSVELLQNICEKYEIDPMHTVQIYILNTVHGCYGQSWKVCKTTLLLIFAQTVCPDRSDLNTRVFTSVKPTPRAHGWTSHHLKPHSWAPPPPPFTYMISFGSLEKLCLLQLLCNQLQSTGHVISVVIWILPNSYNSKKR